MGAGARCSGLTPAPTAERLAGVPFLLWAWGSLGSWRHTREDCKPSMCTRQLQSWDQLDVQNFMLTSRNEATSK